MRRNHEITKKRVAIITNNIHCERHTQYFSTLEKYFRFNGWEIAADFRVHKIILCSCGFHDAMQEKITRALADLRRLDFLEKNLIVMGCLPKTHEAYLQKHFKGQVVELNHEEDLDEIINASIPFKQVSPVNVFRVHEKCGLALRESPLFHIKISQGCLRQCTFCVINKAKGYLKSVPFEEIAAQCQKALKLGKKKLFLMGEDTFAYGIDSNTTIIRLIEKINALAPGLELYFGYLHIRWLKKYAAEILSLCKAGVLRELHIGLQHVNDRLLESMGRPALFSEIYDIIRRIKAECPGIYMVADIMVGFPGETPEMFRELVEFFKQDRCFDKIKHFGYSDVYGSHSSTFPDKVPADVITQRWDDLNEILGERAYSNQDNESRIDNETFRITRFDDYSFCHDTFSEEIDGKGPVVSLDLEMAETGILSCDEGDFKFQDPGQ